MTRLKGKRFSGEGNASRTVAIQLPFITETFPEIRGCHCGTINLEFEAPLIVAYPDHRTLPIKWKQSLEVGEVFDLVRVSLESSTNGTAHDAWLYLAHRSAHRKNLLRHEFIAPYFNMDTVEELGVVIKRPCIHLSYRHNPVYVVV